MLPPPTEHRLIVPPPTMPLKAHLLQDAGWRGPTALERGNFKLDPKLTTSAAGGRIRCPHCRWQPNKGSRWGCYPAGDPEFFSNACGASWNTFDTRGRCPGCNYQWKHTSCLSCGKWALHDDWYEPAAGKGPRQG